MDNSLILQKISLEPPFEIRAKGDIATPDRQGTFWYRDGDFVATVTTGRDGQIDSTAFAPNGTEATYDFLSVSHNGAAGEVSITLPRRSCTVVAFKFLMGRMAFTSILSEVAVTVVRSL